MVRNCLMACVLVALGAVVARASIMDSAIFINEIHYDNTGADVDELVEVVAPAEFSDLSTVTLTLYNGGDGQPYGSPVELAGFRAGAEVNGFRFYTLAIALQNGSPDGLALALESDVLQFLSYEGTFVAVGGSAAGLLSTDLGVSETTSTPIGNSLQLTGTGDSYADFLWTGPIRATPGDVNRDQQLGRASEVPEPATWCVWLIGALCILPFGTSQRWRIDTHQDIPWVGSGWSIRRSSSHGETGK